jgi:hypothetical protein
MMIQCFPHFIRSLSAVLIFSLSLRHPAPLLALRWIGGQIPQFRSFRSVFRNGPVHAVRSRSGTTSPPLRSLSR